MDSVIRKIRNITKPGRRKIFIVAGLAMLLTFCYHIRPLSLLYHKEGVLHNNIFEYQTTFKCHKNEVFLAILRPGGEEFDFSARKLRSYELIFLTKYIDNRLVFYLSSQKSRDGPTLLIQQS